MWSTHLWPLPDDTAKLARLGGERAVIWRELCIDVERALTLTLFLQLVIVLVLVLDHRVEPTHPDSMYCLWSALGFVFLLDTEGSNALEL
ncbi:hypothetical protein ElyMa_002270200 [Elysia marginata]|uniref:Uncharacterized protein n=1 Tax=Elysia marginata TaxID=1093978 RepID=A0AAV4G0U0_9GAST|nr:hypothetical protein ElyMa_002270200 [Elysia marginata]